MTTRPGRKFSLLSSVIRHLFGFSGSPKIVPFTGFGNANTAYISGLVVEDNGLARPVEGQGRWKNIKAMLKRYLSNEIEGIQVKVSFHDMSEIITTDKYGIYRCNFTYEREKVPDDIWQKTTIELLQPFHRNMMKDKAEGDVMIIKDDPQYGVISDIDDTILVSYATKKLTQLRLMIMNNAYTRLPFEGVSAFYQALQKGTEKGKTNPVFYLSNSEWNLYDLLYEFIDFNRIPKGPMMLREMEINIFKPWKIRSVKKNHKTEVLQQLLSTFSTMNFILIGDSGQRDPEIYQDIVKKFPGRIPAIYIRDVGTEEKVAKVKTIAQNVLEESKTEMVLVKDTEAAARHAASKGFILPDHLEKVIIQKKEDIEMQGNPAEKLI